MTDQESVKPIEVKSSLAPDAGMQALRYGLVFASAIALYHFIQSETVVGAGAAFMTAVVTYGSGFWAMVKRHVKLKALAHMLPDDKAVVK